MGKPLLSVDDGDMCVREQNAGSIVARTQPRRTSANVEPPNPILTFSPDSIPRLHSNITAVVPISTRRIRSLPSTVSWEVPFLEDSIIQSEYTLPTFVMMHFATMVQHATRTRTKSVQFEKSVISLEPTDESCSREGATSPPVPGTRTSSLPLGDNKENINVIRHYRSMLDVEGAPKLPMTKPMSYEELYLKPTESMSFNRFLWRMPIDC
jgi:hypothetical protein